MAQYTDEQVQQAWDALWKSGSDLYAPTALEQGLPPNGTEVPAAESATFDETEPVTLIKHEDFGPVSISFRDVRLRHLSEVSGQSVDYDGQSGKITVKLGFEALMLQGVFGVAEGQEGHGVAEVAAETLGPIALEEAPAESQAQENIAQAKAYRTKLLSQDSKTQSGPFMVQQYYDNNLAYSELFAIPSIKLQWTTHTTNNQTSAYYAAHTTSCAQNPDDNLNGQPTADGHSYYNEHSFWQQTLVMKGCYAAQSYYNGKGSNPDKAKRYGKAGDAASSFKTKTQPHSTSPQTVNSVMAITASNPPPSEDELQSSLMAPEAVATAGQDMPEWLRKIEADGQRTHDAVIQDLTTRHALAASTDHLYQGAFSGGLPGASLVVSGTLDGSGAAQFTDVQVTLPTLHIALESPQRGPIAKLLHDVNRALQNAQLLQDLLRAKASSAIADGTLGTSLGGLLTRALEAQTSSAPDPAP